MFLGTMALSDFWERDREILFLGSWCLRHDRRREWEGLRYAVMPCPWEDRERFHHAAQYIDEYYERLLGDLTDVLNAAHDISRRQRYWRVLIGPWLLEYLHVLYDRYVRLTDALGRHPGLETIVIDPCLGQVSTGH